MPRMTEEEADALDELVTKNRLIFPTDDAIFKILYLAIQNASKKWTMPIRDWGQAINQFAIEFGTERVPLL